MSTESNVKPIPVPFPEGYPKDYFVLKEEDLIKNTEIVDDGEKEYIVIGDGLFDNLMEVAAKHLKAQFDSNRIRQEDYAQMYLDLYKTTLQLAIQAWLQKKTTEAQILTAFKQLDSEDAKKGLYKRQIEAFDEDYKHKILKVMMDAWSVGFSVAKDSFEAAGIPAPMQKVTIDDLYNKFVLTDLDNYTYSREEATTSNTSL